MRGPIDVYYYDHLDAALGDPDRKPTALEQRGGPFAFEALNFVDGKRSVSEIRDLLTGRYSPVPPAEVAEWLDLLAKADVVKLRGR